MIKKEKRARQSRTEKALYKYHSHSVPDSFVKKSEDNESMGLFPLLVLHLPTS